MKLEDFVYKHELGVAGVGGEQEDFHDCPPGLHVIGTCSSCKGYPFAADHYCSRADLFVTACEEDNEGRDFGCIHWTEIVLILNI